MISNKERASNYFLMSLSTWFIFFIVYLFILIINAMIFDFTNLYIKIILFGLGVVMVMFLYLIFRIKTVTIDILGMGFNCIEQPVFFSYFGNSFSKHYQLDSKSIDKINFKDFFFKKLCIVLNSKKGKKNRVSIPLYFFEKRMISKMEMQFLSNEYFNSKILLTNGNNRMIV